MEFDGDDFGDDDGGGDALQALKNDVLAGMRAYLADMLDGGGDAGYSGADVGECGRILDVYLAGTGAAEHGDDEAVGALLQHVVRSLDAVNARCGGRLIETDQGDQLRALITRAAEAAGVSPGGDVTAVMRAW